VTFVRRNDPGAMGFLAVRHRCPEMSRNRVS
jgi:hypothetical protein